MYVKSICHYCGGRSNSIDHRNPIARGGATDAFNLVPACSECNGLKDRRTPGEFLEYCREIVMSQSPKLERYRGRARTILSRLAPEMLG